MTTDVTPQTLQQLALYLQQTLQPATRKQGNDSSLHAP
jgi:hypothetical protein